VSSRATSGTTFRFHFGPRLTHFRFNSVLRSRLSKSFHSPQHAFKFVPPPALGVKRDQYARLLLQPKRSERFKHTFLIHGSDRLFDMMSVFWRRHERIIPAYLTSGKRRRAQLVLARLDRVIKSGECQEPR